VGSRCREPNSWHRNQPAHCRFRSPGF